MVAFIYMTHVLSKHPPLTSCFLCGRSKRNANPFLPNRIQSRSIVSIECRQIIYPQDQLLLRQYGMIWGKGVSGMTRELEPSKYLNIDLDSSKYMGLIYISGSQLCLFKIRSFLSTTALLLAMICFSDVNIWCSREGNRTDIGCDHTH